MSAAPPSLDSVETLSAVLPERLSWHSRKLVRIGLVSLITFCSLLLRLHALGAKSIWLDESISIAIARLPWSQFVRVLWQREANMTLYYLLLRFWILAGSSEVFVRALSVLFSVATVPLLYALAARLFGRPTGLLAAWFLAINAYDIRYAQEARSYALLVFLAVVSTLLLVRNIQERTNTRWWLYSVVAALTVYAHFFGALMIAAHLISLLALEPREVPWRDFGRSVRWAIVMTVPLAAVILLNGSASSFWLARPSWHDLDAFFRALAGNGGHLLVILNAAVLTVTVGFAWLQWRAAGKTAQTWAFALLFAWLCSPLGIVLAVSAWRPIFVARFLIFCVPPVALGVAVAITRLRPRPVAWVLGAVLSILSVQGAISYYRRDFDIYREDWRSATAYILERSQPGDGIFFPTFGRMPYEYYKSRHMPAVVGPQSINFPGGDVLESRDFVVRPVAEMLRDAKPAPDRVWLILFLDRTPAGDENPTSTMLRAWYGKNRTLVAQQEFAQIRVYLYEKESGVRNTSQNSQLAN